jgi:type IV pilus assembly protein PilC
MPMYKCKMASSGGRVLEKTLTASTSGLLRRHLEGEGHFILEIRRIDGFWSRVRSGRGVGRVKTKDFLSFNQELSVLLKAGLPIISALDAIIEKRGAGEFTDILKEIRNDVSGGESLSGAFDRFSHVFSKLYVASLQAGEKSGNIISALSRHTDYIKKMAAVKRRVVSASVYPAILSVASVAALLFLLTYVVPTFMRTYLEAGTPLPGITLFLVRTGQFLASNLQTLLLVSALGFVGFSLAGKTERGRLLVDRVKLQIPGLGKIYLHFILSRFARTMAMVLSAGSSLMESLRISTVAVDNLFLKLRLSETRRALEAGGSLSESLSRSGVLPGLAVRMIDAGEQSGSLEPVFLDMAEFYETDVDTKLSILMSSMEPALMIIMGLLIGFIVLAMYLPIFQMASMVG